MIFEIKQPKIIVLLLLLILNIATGYTQTYVEAAPQAGEGAILLLKRYDLDRYDCNLDQFYKLNKLSKNAALLVGKNYKLPIEIKKYDAKSIRTTLNINELETAQRIERYNNKQLQKGIKKADFKTNKELWLPYHSLHCDKLPPVLTPKNRNFAIFGEKHSTVALKSQKLEQAVYYIVSGHGGPDAGAMATFQNKNICEDEYAYDISLRLAKLLLEQGALVYLINRDQDGIRESEFLPCDADETVWENQEIPLDQKERLTQRSDVINELYEKHKAQGTEYQCLIEIHVDSRSESQRTDLFFYYEPHQTADFQLANTLQQVFKQKYKKYRKSGDYKGSVIARDLHMLRETRPMATFIEVANIQNAADRQRIVVPQNRQLIAEWLLEGLLENY